MRIGVFDSGIGGKIVALQLQKILPDFEITYVSDHRNMPYGNRTDSEIIQLTDSAIQPLLDSCKIIVIACNTATAIAISFLRNKYKDKIFIGFEPMLKPAVGLTKTKKIAVLATPKTLSSKHYLDLKKQWTENTAVFEPDCSAWAKLIENNESSKINLDYFIKDLLLKNIDVIILGCTHYHWLKTDIETIVKDRALVLEPTEAIAKRIIELSTAY